MLPCSSFFTLHSDHPNFPSNQRPRRHVTETPLLLGCTGHPEIQTHHALRSIGLACSGGTRPFTKTRLLRNMVQGRLRVMALVAGRRGAKEGEGSLCKEGQGAWGGEEIFEVRDAS